MNFNDMLPTVGAIDQGYCLKLTTALLHFLWQGCAVALLFGIATFALRRSTAAARHLAGAVALALMAACLPLTLCFLPSKQADVSPVVVSSRVELLSETLPPEPAAEVDLNEAYYEVGATAGLSSSATPLPQKDSAEKADSGTPIMPLYISAIYLCGVVLMLVRVVLGVWGVGRLRRKCTPIDDWAVLDIIQDCARRMALRATPAVAYCRRIGVPMAVGLLRPMILLPAALASGLTPQQLQAVLLHEMAHLRRHDLIVNILQRLVEALLFFHPAVWWISRRVSVERENACDDLAALAGEDHLQYADALLRAAEICTVGRQSTAALAATGSNRSQLAARLLRLLGQDQRPTFRLTIVGAAVSVLLACALLLTPAMLRGAGDEAKKDQPVSMLAEDFMRLTPAEQRDLLVSVFQHRLKHSNNLFYETEQTLMFRKNLNGELGGPIDDKPDMCRRFRHWRLNDSFRQDTDAYHSFSDAKPWNSSWNGVNGEEGIGRNKHINFDGTHPPSGQVQYAYNLAGNNYYLYWFDMKFPQQYPNALGEYLFPYLLRYKKEYKFEKAGDFIRLSVPWQPSWAKEPEGERVYLLDPSKGFLPVKCDARWDGKLSNGQPNWRRESFEVEESRNVDGVWMPMRFTFRLSASTIPDMIDIWKIHVLRMEHGAVKPADLMIPFDEGMQIQDTIEGVTYVADAEGNPVEPVKNAPNWKHTPPDWWKKRYGKVNPGAGGYSLASRFSPADDFMRLTPAEQRDLLVRVFQHRLEQADNLYYKTEQLFEVRKNNNGSPGELLEDKPESRFVYRHWRLNDSCRMDTDTYRTLDDAEPYSKSSYGVNAEEGLARTANVSLDGKHPPTGHVLYPQNPDNNNLYIFWLDRKFPQPKEHASSTGEPLFQNILRHKDEFKIEPAGELIRLSVPWKPWWAEKPSGTQVCLLDPQKGYLPVKCDLRWDEKPDDGKPIWGKASHTVKECRLVGDVWMPVKVTEQHFLSLFPDTIAVCNINVLDIEAGKVKPDDLMVRFEERMQIFDVVKGISYTADAHGKPAGRFIASDKMDPPDWWIKRFGKVNPGADGYSLASKISEADRKRLADENAQLEGEKAQQREALEKPFQKLKSLPPEDVNGRIDAAMEILRTFRAGENIDIWAGTIRELILMGKPAVPRLIEELDRCKGDKTMRALGFVLRGIGDPRAIPALIRALPRSFESHGDCGLPIIDDPELLQFMLKHDNTPNDENSPHASRFSFGSPTREIMTALEKQTGQTLGWWPLRFVHLKGGAQQQRVIKTQVLAFARRWADWWKNDWRKYLDDESEAQLDSIEKSLQEYANSIPKASSIQRDFPRGPNVIMDGGVHDEGIRSFKKSPSNGFRDLDSGRRPNPPKNLVEESTADAPSKNLLSWAEREGVDLILVERESPGRKKPYIAFMPVGMKVWRIDSDRYDGLLDELRAGGELDLPEPWEGLIAQTNPKTGAFDEDQPTVYLFITAEGVCGVIRLTADGMLYSFFYAGTKNIDAVEDTSDTAEPPEKRAGGFEFDPHSRRNIRSDINKAINHGASRASEQAVSKALKWIAQHQLEDGGWSFDLEKCPGCEGKCRNSGSYSEARVAATGLALLPFLGAGDTHKNEGPYQSAIQAGLDFLVDHIQKSDHGGSLREPEGTMYSHGIGTIALCEAYCMTKDPDLLSPARETLKYICYAQDPDGGGWRYTPRQKGDTSVVGWQLTALRSGHAAGFQIPFEVVERTSKFLDGVQSKDGAAYGYLTPGQGEATTAAGLLCRIYLAWSRDNPALKQGVQLLGKRGPSPSNMYYNYYATQVMQYWGGEPWENWNSTMRDRLVQSQAEEGHEEGSWFTGSGDLGSATGGRLYCTSMATMILEVYYRSMFVNTTESSD